MGELHLEIIVDRLKREFSVEATVGKPQVAYKETLTRPADGEMKYAKQTGGRGQYGHVQDPSLSRASRAPATSSRTRSRGGSIPKEFIKPIDEGIKEALTRGVLAGYPIDDVRIELVRRLVPRRRLVGNGVQDRRLDGVPGRGEESQAGAARAGDARRGGRPEGAHGRRDGQPRRAGAARFSRRKTAAARRSSTRGCRCRRCSATRPTSARGRRARATYSMHFDRYEQAPPNVSEEVVARMQGK